MAKVLGIINEAEIENQTDLSKYEEVGLYGFKQARETILTLKKVQEMLKKTEFMLMKSMENNSLI